MDEHEEPRTALLRAIWQDILAITPATVRNFPSADRAIEAGATVEDVITAMQGASYETAYRVLYLIDSHLAAGVLGGIFEDLMEADPSGRGAADLWD